MAPSRRKSAPGEYSSTGARIQETIRVDDIPVATLRPNGGTACALTLWIFYVHSDHLGHGVYLCGWGEKRNNGLNGVSAGSRHSGCTRPRADLGPLKLAVRKRSLEIHC
jgi:hypothetical protein